jgi:hypothetical protein
MPSLNAQQLFFSLADGMIQGRTVVNAQQLFSHWLIDNKKNQWMCRKGQELVLLLVLQAGLCFLSNGFLPSIQSYSCLPYGRSHLTV